MRLRSGLVVLACASVAGCSILIDSSGFTSPPAPPPDPLPTADAADDAALIDAAPDDGDADDDDDGAPRVHPYVQAVLADGPSLYYRLEETSDGPVRDEMETYPGTYLSGGIHSAPGAFAGSSGLRLAGPGGIDAGDVLDFESSSPFTLEAWYRPGEYDTQYRFLFHNNDERTVRQNYGLYFQSESGLGFERYVDGQGRAAHTSLPALGAWYHFACVYDGSVLRLFIDGQLVASNADTRAAKDKKSPLMIGYGYNGGGVVIGVIDEIAIYEKALDAARIRAHIAAAK
ncbi:MAG: LamG domain-containing protein [Labilithrix sp.]|nr:LamG domain-containing protein [Labilithrix sp.]